MERYQLGGTPVKSSPPPCTTHVSTRRRLMEMRTLITSELLALRAASASPRRRARSNPGNMFNPSLRCLNSLSSKQPWLHSFQFLLENSASLAVHLATATSCSTSSPVVKKFFRRLVGYVLIRSLLDAPPRYTDRP